MAKIYIIRSMNNKKT